ncbi:MAG: hypothetical protein R3D33_08800 [Hyphomicrobiaceae bacterium]
MLAVIALLAALFWLAPAGPARAGGLDAVPIVSRNMEVSRARATESPLKEADQAISDGWPLYRTDTGQQIYNRMMATLDATDGPTPSAGDFAGCAELNCNLVLPELSSLGWLPAGRLWLSPDEYVLFVVSPRGKGLDDYRRRPKSGMRIFVYHEFQNSTTNTDPYDTISSHSGTVFVSFYMSKPAVDAAGRSFVVVTQIAPHDVVSRHASNWGSAGPGIEVAKNTGEKLAPLQARAGIVVATIVKAAEPQLRVVNHRNVEGLPMLKAYEARLAWLAAHPGAARVALPFVAASDARIAAASAPLAELIRLPGTTRVASAATSLTIPAAMVPVPVPVTSIALRAGVPVPVEAKRPLSLTGMIRRMMKETAEE